MGIYAVIKTGGKQYRVSPGDVLKVEKLPASTGSAIEISDVFLFVNGGEVAVGNPTVATVRVVAELIEEGRGEKIRVFKKRRRKHYQKTIGHRQHYSAIRINEIIHGDKRYKADAGDVSSSRADDHKAEPIKSLPGTVLSALRSDVAPLQSSPKAGDHGPTSTAAAPTRAPVTTPPAAPPHIVDAPVRAAALNSDERRPAPDATYRATHPAPPAQDSADIKHDAPDTGEVPAPRPRDVAAPTPSPSPPLPRVERASAAANTEASHRKELYWSLAALLAVLLGGAGWLLNEDGEPVIEHAHVDPASLNPAAVNTAPVETASAEQMHGQPAVQEVKVRKPSRAASPSAPAQPPD